jgi:hypothetical protein
LNKDKLIETFEDTSRKFEKKHGRISEKKLLKSKKIQESGIYNT